MDANTTYLFDNKKRPIAAINPDDVQTSEQTSELNAVTIHTLTASYTPAINTAAYFGMKDMQNSDNFIMYKISKLIIDDTTFTIDGVHILFDDLAGRGGIFEAYGPNAEPIALLMGRILAGTGWEVQDEGATGTVTHEYGYEPKNDVFWDSLKQSGAEFSTTMEYRSGRIVRKIVHLHNEIAVDTGKWYEYGDKLLSIQKEVDASNTYTAFIGTGSDVTGTDGSTKKLLFGDIEWLQSEGRLLDKPMGQIYLELPSSTEKYGFEDGTPRVGLVDFPTIDDPNILLLATSAHLLKESRPKVHFKADVEDNEACELGETVRIIRDDLNIRYKTRIFKMTRNFKTKRTQSFEFGDKLQKTQAERIKEERANTKAAVSQLKKELAPVAPPGPETFHAESNGPRFNILPRRYVRTGGIGPIRPKQRGLAFINMTFFARYGGSIAGMQGVQILESVKLNNILRMNRVDIDGEQLTKNIVSHRLPMAETSGVYTWQNQTVTLSAVVPVDPKYTYAFGVWSNVEGRAYESGSIEWWVEEELPVVSLYNYSYATDIPKGICTLSMTVENDHNLLFQLPTDYGPDGQLVPTDPSIPDPIEPAITTRANMDYWHLDDGEILIVEVGTYDNQIITSAVQMFKNSTLREVRTGALDMPNNTNYTEMFADTADLAIIESLILPYGAAFADMFNNCNPEIVVNNIDATIPTHLNGMFRGSLIRVIAPGALNIGTNTISINQMFEGATNIQKIVLSDLENVLGTRDAFKGAGQISHLELYGLGSAAPDEPQILDVSTTALDPAGLDVLAASLGQTPAGSSSWTLIYSLALPWDGAAAIAKGWIVQEG